MAKVVIGIDQSYADTGITVAVNGKIKKIYDINYKGIKGNTAKRAHMAYWIERLINKIPDGHELIIITERIRTRSHTTGGREFISNDYIKSTGALVATIIDVAERYGVDVYSVDTRSWKAQVLGSAISKKKKSGVVARKETAVQKVISLGFKEEISYRLKSGPNKGKLKYNDNMADSACIALYGFIPEYKQKLKPEKF